MERRTRIQLEQRLKQATRVVSATCNDLLTPLSAIELAMSLLSDDQDFRGKLSENQKESFEITRNCVNVIGKVCRGIRNEYSATCSRQVDAVKGFNGPQSAPIRKVSGAYGRKAGSGDNNEIKSVETEHESERDHALFIESQPRKRRALIIEDSLVIRKVIVNALRKIGIETEIAVNGMEGLHKLQCSYYDVVLCDFLMPVMDGLDFVKQYRDWEKENRPCFRQYIIGMSAHASKKDVERGIKAGMDSYEPKPLTYKDLQAIFLACKEKKQEVSPSNNSVMDQTIPATMDDTTSVVSTPSSGSHSRTCLIASQDELLCNIATKTAATRGWKPIVVQDCKNALQALQKQNWGVCFLDENLAPLSGIKCLSDFRKWEQLHRVNLQMNLFILHSPGSEVSEGGGWPGPTVANGVLHKPLRQDEFKETLEEAEKNQSLHINAI